MWSDIARYNYLLFPFRGDETWCEETFCHSQLLKMCQEFLVIIISESNKIAFIYRNSDHHDSPPLFSVFSTNHSLSFLLHCIMPYFAFLTDRSLPFLFHCNRPFNRFLIVHTLFFHCVRLFALFSTYYHFNFIATDHLTDSELSPLFFLFITTEWCRKSREEDHTGTKRT